MSETKRLRIAAWARRMRDFDEETLERIFDLADGGVNTNQIALQIGSHYKAVRDVLGDRDLYDPYVDDVAIHRAGKYEEAVIRNLTRVEWDQFCLAMGERKPWDDPHPPGSAQSRGIPGWGDLPWPCRVAVKTRLAQLQAKQELALAG